MGGRASRSRPPAAGRAPRLPPGGTAVVRAHDHDPGRALRVGTAQVGAADGDVHPLLPRGVDRPVPGHRGGREGVRAERDVGLRLHRGGRDGRLVERRHRQTLGEDDRLGPLGAVVLGADHEHRVGREEVAPHEVDRAPAVFRRGSSLPGVDRDRRSLALAVGLVDLALAPALAAVQRPGEVQLALELAVLVEAVEGGVADVHRVAAAAGPLRSTSTARKGLSRK